MEERLILVETAKTAKDKGYNIVALMGYYMNSMIENPLLLWVDGEVNKIPEFGYAPSQSLLQKWLRDIHNISVDITTTHNSKGLIYFVDIKYIKNEMFNYKSIKNDIHPQLFTPVIFNIYEEALEVGLQEALNLIKI